MNSEILYEYLDNNSFTRENLIINYSFEKIENGIVFNELHDVDAHYPEPGCLSAAIHPGILISCLDHTQFDAYKGCCSLGFFDKETALRIGYKVPYDEWTVFINYNNRVSRDDRNRGEVLFSSMPSPTAASGFHVGLNGSNRLYFEYVNSNGERKNVILPNEIENYNIISISKGANDVRISNHDPFSRKDYNLYYAFDDTFESSDVWAIGNFTESYSPTDNERYRGFHGYIDDFIFFNRAYSESQINTLSEALYFTGVVPAYLKETTVTVETISGIPTKTSVPTEAAIVGYSLEPIQGVTNICEAPITICNEVAIMAAGTKQILDFPRVNVETTVNEIIPEVKLYNEEFAAKYAEKNIVFLKPVDSFDTFEIYSQSGYDEDLNKSLSFNTTANSFFIPLADSVENINLYVNGVRQVAGIDYAVDGTTIINTDTLGAMDGGDTTVYDILDSSVTNLIWDGQDCVLHEMADGEIMMGEMHGGAVKCHEIFVTGSGYLDRDIYFQGQKLIDGLDYYEGIDQNDGITTGIYINTTADGAHGTYSFAPKSSLLETRYTGSMNAFDMLSFNLRNEQVWLNGKRQVEDIDYVKTSSYSLLNNNLRLESKPYTIYNNVEEYFGCLPTPPPPSCCDEGVDGEGTETTAQLTCWEGKGLGALDSQWPDEIMYLYGCYASKELAEIGLTSQMTTLLASFSMGAPDNPRVADDQTACCGELAGYQEGGSNTPGGESAGGEGEGEGECPPGSMNCGEEPEGGWWYCDSYGCAGPSEPTYASTQAGAISRWYDEEQCLCNCAAEDFTCCYKCEANNGAGVTQTTHTCQDTLAEAKTYCIDWAEEASFGEATTSPDPGECGNDC